MQILVSFLNNETAEFPFHLNKDVSDDGYVISAANKALIDSCLAAYPEMLFLCDIPQTPKYDFEETDKPRSIIVYATKTKTIGSGWAVGFKHEVLSSVIAYLIELGAGIGYENRMIIDLRPMKHQLFVGASDEFKNNTPGATKHINHFMNVISLYRFGSLTHEDVPRLSKQCSNGLRYGNFSDEINLELVRITRVLALIKSGLINQLSDRQVVAYVDYNIELHIMLLQVAHQAMPDAILLILSSLTGLSDMEMFGMNENLIANHEKDFPEFKLRR